MLSESICTKYKSNQKYKIFTHRNVRYLSDYEISPANLSAAITNDIPNIADERKKL
ncbi:hypothetical protein D3C87_2102200 [compost metagenome]